MAFTVVAAFLLSAVLPPQESVVPPPPRFPLPHPVANASIARVNDNRHPAGTLSSGTLTLSLDIVEAGYQPEGELDPVVRILAFAETGKAPSVPAPLLRAPVGTTVHLTVHNKSDSALTLGGLRRSMPAERDTVQLAAGATREVTFKLDKAGNFFYWAALKGLNNFDDRNWLDAQLTGALIVDATGSAPAANERVLLITEWFYPVEKTQTFESALTFNGREWPYNEQFTFTQGDSVHFRIVNAAAIEHPLHLHGFYFRVTRSGGARADTVVPPALQPLQNMRIIPIGGSMTLAFVPTTPGNWVFHCHFAGHIDEIVSLHGSPEPNIVLASSSDHAMPAHDKPGGHTMRGLVIGIHVTPSPTFKEKAVTDRRTINLLIQKHENGLMGNQPAYGFVLQTGKEVPARDSVIIPGPVLELKRGEPVRILVHNNLDEASGVHWHGLEIESYPDGVSDWSGMGDKIMPPIPPGGTFAAEFTPPRSGTFPYHSHLHEMRQIASGMYGAIIVSDSPRDTTKDHLIVAGGGGLPEFYKLGPSTLLVNGRMEPPAIVMTVGDTNRLRIVSIHADEVLNFRFGTEEQVVKWRPLARDGADLPMALRAPKSALARLGPGETADFTYVPTKAGEMRLEVWVGGGGRRVLLPVEIRERQKTKKAAE
ncbi:MAG TPA: multicopper oxidase domain-containing protein [Gemmatimonadaceae bacterium]|jgi:FtsP/CotA-like multicopper oxidase with cupredoxin domain|nr:multicopper oxidase domain-containing protein [Gemmatimonadaceae bacterium]